MTLAAGELSRKVLLGSSRSGLEWWLHLSFHSGGMIVIAALVAAEPLSRALEHSDRRELVFVEDPWTPLFCEC